MIAVGPLQMNAVGQMAVALNGCGRSWIATDDQWHVSLLLNALACFMAANGRMPQWGALVLAATFVQGGRGNGSLDWSAQSNKQTVGWRIRRLSFAIDYDARSHLGIKLPFA